MILISTALYHEAKPLIQHFRLKKATLPSSQPGRIQLFTGNPSDQEIWLVVGGTGPLAAAVATTYALTMARVSELRSSEQVLFLNIGICGAAREDLARGEAVLCHKIIHHDTGRAYFPDVLIRHPFREGVLETFSRAVANPLQPEDHAVQTVHRFTPRENGTVQGSKSTPEKNTEAEEAGERIHPAGDVVDMEGAGGFEAAAAFLPPHRMLFIKVVSDHLDAAVPRHPDTGKRKTYRLDGAAISGLIAGQIPALEEVLRRAKQLNDAIEAPLLTDEEAQLLRSLQEHLRLTATMSHQLRHLALQYKAATGGAGSLEILRPFLRQPVQTKQEGKMALEQIHTLLLPD